MLLDGGTTVYVTGVMKDMPQNSHFRVDIFLSLSLLTEVWNPNRKNAWRSLGCYSYLLIEEGTNPKELAASITKMVGDHVDKSKEEYVMSLKLLDQLYLYADPRGYRTGTSNVGNADDIQTLAIVALFVLFIAAFNFVNLSTALSLNRAKEISMRKILGISKRELVWHFMLDAVVFTLVAFMIAMLISMFIFPYFNSFIGRQINNDIISLLRPMSWLLMAVMMVGLIGGMYPAIFLSGVKTLKGLKGRFVSTSYGIGMRKTLVVAQFAISIVLITSTLGVYHQLKFMTSQDLGYSKSQKLILDFYFDKTIKKKAASVKQQLMTIPGVESVSMSSCVPGMASRKYNTSIPDESDLLQTIRTPQYMIDYDFLNQYKIEVVAGRAFDEAFNTDAKNGMILNEAAVKELGYIRPVDVIGKSFEQGRYGKGKIIGVVKDFHYESMRNKIRPLVMTVGTGKFPMTILTLNISSTNVFETLDLIKKEWNKFEVERPFSFHFTDQAFQAQYEEEHRFGKLILYLSGLAILISSLGLLGLSAFSTTQRTKEIGIRKCWAHLPLHYLSC